MEFAKSPRAEGLHEARAYLQHARQRCPEPATASFLDLILEKVDLKIRDAEAAAPVSPSVSSCNVQPGGSRHVRFGIQDGQAQATQSGSR